MPVMLKRSLTSLLLLAAGFILGTLWNHDIQPAVTNSWPLQAYRYCQEDPSQSADACIKAYEARLIAAQGTQEKPAPPLAGNWLTFWRGAMGF